MMALLTLRRRLSESRLSISLMFFWRKDIAFSGIIVFFGLTMALCSVLPNAFAAKQDPSSVVQNGSPSEIDSSNIELKINEVKKRLAEAKAEENEQKVNQLGITLSQLQDRSLKLEDLETVYQRLITALRKKTLLEKEEALLGKKWQAQQQIEISQEPPYSLSFHDNIFDQLAMADQKKETVELEKSLAKKALEDVRSRLEEGKQTLRKYKEKTEIKGTGIEASKLNWEIGQAQLEVEIALAIFDLQSVTQKNLSVEVQLASLQADVARQNIAWVRKHLHFDRDDLEKQLETIEQTRTELQKRLKEQLRGQIRVEALWLQAQDRVVNAKGAMEIALAKAALEANETRRNASQKLLEQAEDALQLLNQQEQAWKNRYAMVNGEINTEQLDTWYKEFETRKITIERTVRLQESNQTNLQAQIAVLIKQISEQNLDKRLRQELENRLQAFRRLADGNLKYLSTLLATVQMHQRLLDEIGTRREYNDLWKMLSDLKGNVRQFWNFEVWVIDGYGVTVRKLVVTLLILIIGLTFVKKMILLVTRRLLKRTHLKETTIAASEKVINYFTVLLIVLFALRVVNIPLTIFTFLGGAIAIGVGFGAQNLINNFISGFIIMAEQPIKIGDLIDIEGNFAIVEEIGARCTRIRTGANIHILVPNSSFLEKNIVNWTLSDTEIRAQVTAGVIYGSPVREVERIMIQVANEHKKVKKNPEPFVLFNDFGDNSLIFDLCFWISMTRIMDRRIIESDIRFHIDELFRKAGIVIAFPQRDVHLDTQSPL
ncbi:MAG TPA: mechanosensitive ion channel domain-containing protein, partial [Desulfobacterales bacterium]|nr:mechanosensitive ion channel domain-containing protein [Desulfobacterales bacterium]